MNKNIVQRSMKTFIKKISVIPLTFSFLLCILQYSQITANAARVYYATDSYSTIHVDKSGDTITVVLNCINGPRYSTLSIISYGLSGEYVDQTSQACILQTGQSIILQIDANAYSYLICGNIYPNSTPYETPLSLWSLIL